MTRSVDDIHCFEGQLTKIRERLQKSVMTYNGEKYEGHQIPAITPENKAIFEKFLLKLRREEKAIGTIVTHLNYMMRFAQGVLKIGYTGTIIDVDADTFDMFLLNLEDEGVKTGTIRTYKKSLKKFFSAMTDEPPKWIRDLKLKSLDSPIQPSDLLTKEEFASLLDACKKPRDKAFIAVLADGGMRIGALASCRIKHVTFGQYGAIMFLSKSSKSNKTTPAKGIPLTWSTGYLNQWLSIHPLKDNVEAPLWVSNNCRAEAMSYKSLREMIVNVGGQAGISKRINPHMFRHLAITNWILDGLSEAEIKHRAGWSKSSNQMFKVYANFTDKEINDSIYEKYGLKTENKRIVALKTCPRCNNVLQAEDKFCSQCSLVLDQATLRAMDTEKELFKVLLEGLINEHPDLLQKLFGKT